jgi:SAM-dependent methyltransferase
LDKFRAGPSRLLDLACGTGRHAFELEQMGWAVEGSDISPAMVARAREAASRRASSVRFHNHSFQTADCIGRDFDAVISMFSAIGYLSDHAEFALALRNVRRILSPGGTFVFDYWNGPAVLSDYSPVRVLRKQDGSREILRISETSLDVMRQVAEVKFTFMTFLDGRKTGEFEEVHNVRFFFPREIEALLAAGGFQVAYMSPFLELDRPVHPHDWNVTIAAVVSNP